ncbi:DUF5718 family protein [Halobacteriovorax sp. GB3]|uniref:DUF5718 family protein n=1 Tax=Halobacteriovorax sp. GB3 TaxID=2719615 RepID=UPI002362550E|nr:DUF5718 family protein [Halobacteriovorax sp. GB3]MDD0851711.1 DUF5718 family protein [Halobacteriovorax sp. GB3]
MNFESMIGFGVAGNFAGHLEQAREAKDFEKVEVAEENQPKAVFPFYLPNNITDNNLKIMPISCDQLKFPETSHDVQIEPEVALICDIEYEGDQVVSLNPILFGAYNDCSIRRPGAKKISEKKNWGECSKGLSDQLIPIDTFNEGGILDHYQITCFHRVDSELIQYGEVSDVLSYSYFHQKLLDWVVDRLNYQKNEGPAENIHDYLMRAGRPSQCLLSIGATRYTEYGKTNFLSVGDESIVVVYDKRKYSNLDILENLKNGNHQLDGASFLVQKVVS